MSMVVSLVLALFIIVSRTVVANMSNRVLKNDYASIYNVRLTKSGRARLKVTRVPMSRTLKQAQFEKSIMTRTIIGNVKRITDKDSAPFSKTYLSLELAANKGMMNRILSKGNGIWIYFDGRDTMVLLENQGVFTNILGENNRVVDITTLRKEDLVHYETFNFSPSNLRTVQIMMMAVNLEGGDRRRHVLNLVSDGAFDRLAGKEVDVVDLIKLSSRFGQSNPGSVNFGVIPGWAYYNGKLGRMGKDIHGAETFLELFDGINIYRASYVAAVFSARMPGIQIKPEAVVGMFIQNRPATIKAAGVVVSDAQFDAILTRMDSSKLSFHGDKDNVVMISDKNAVKAAFDFDKPINFEILDFARSSEVRLSKQMVEKMLDADREGTVEYLSTLFNEQVVAELDKVFFGRKAQIPTIEDILDGYPVDTVLKMAPKYVGKDPAFFDAVARNLIQRLVKIVDKMGFSVDMGANLRLVPDISWLIAGHDILNYGEMFIKAALKDVKNGANKGVFIKYPAMGAKEVYVATMLDLNTIKKRVRALPISDAEKTMVIDFFVNCHDGTCVVPAREIIKKQCAGLDFDFDGATVYWQPELVKLFADYKPLAVWISEEKKPEVVEPVVAKPGRVSLRQVLGGLTLNTDKFVFDVVNFAVAYIRQVASGNRPVGVVTHANNTIVSISQLPFEQFKDIAKRAILKSVKGSKNGSAKYVPLPKKTVVIDGVEIIVVEVSPQKSKDIVEALQNGINLDDDDNLKALYEDFNHLYRMYQELTIDAAKKGTIVEIDIALGAVCALSLRTLKHNYDGQFDGKFAITRDIPENDAPDEMPSREFFVDTVSELQDEFCRDLEWIVNNKLKGEHEKVRFSVEELAVFEGYRSSHAHLLADLNTNGKYPYSILSSNYSAAIKALKETYFDAEELEEAMKGARDEYNENISVLGNYVRQMLHGIDLVDAGRILKLAAMTGKDNTTKANDPNHMAINLCPERFMAMILADYAEVDICGYQLVSGNPEVGTVISLQHGAAEGVLVKADYTGELEIVEFNGQKYAVKKIADVLPNTEADFTKGAFVVRAGLPTKAGEKWSSYDVVADQLEENASITFHDSDVLFGTHFNDVVKIGGKSVCRFKTESSITKKLLLGVEGATVTRIVDVTRVDENRSSRTLIVEFSVNDRKDVEVAPDKPIVATSAKEFEVKETDDVI